MGTAARSSRGSTFRNFFTYRVFVSALFTLLFLAAVSVVLTTNPASIQQSPNSGTVPAYVSRTFLALKSNPLKTRLDLIYKQATDHIALVNAYTAYARKLKLENSKQLKTFEDLVRDFSDLTSRPAYKQALIDTDAPIDEDVLRQFEKDAKERIKVARQLVVETKESFDNQLKIQKLKDTIFAVNEQLTKAKKHGAVSSLISAKSIPKSLHCIAMRLVNELIAHPEEYVEEKHQAFEDPSLYHYAIFSDNVIAASVVVNSCARNTLEPTKHVFHIVTNRMMVAAMRVWFKMRPILGGALVEVKAMEDFDLFDSSRLRSLDHMVFYLPEMYPNLHQILYLDDDVVVQRDLTRLWRINMEGKVNGAVEICFGPFHRFGHYLNFSHPVIRERFIPKACAWAFGMNLFNLDAWRREMSTDQYRYWMNMNENNTLWKTGRLPLGLVTFYGTTKPLDKSWHVMGLGYNPSISMDDIKQAAVIHFNGDMKPWLDIAMNQFKELWTKYVDSDMEFVQACNFGL
ncbi:probable galacturonosyltransferase 9 [Aristolochia californica]|uniref:probable galacturonosyltransferase 9 n=1 Tax=Aristolochia californica TaxID=171875 RepID=UPI0035DE2FBF